MGQAKQRGTFEARQAAAIQARLIEEQKKAADLAAEKKRKRDRWNALSPEEKEHYIKAQVWLQQNGLGHLSEFFTD